MSTEASRFGEMPVQPNLEEGIVAEVHVDHDRLVLRPTLRRLTDATIEPQYNARSDNGRELSFVSIRADSAEAVDAALAADPTVRNPVLVDRLDGQLVYRVELTESAITVSGTLAGVGGRILDATGTTTAWVFQLRLPSRDALVAFNDECKRRNVSVRVTHLRSADDETTAFLGLTEKQQELLTVAYQEGYFDVPRGISQEELASKMDVSKSAVSQRLRRALAELCETSLRD